MRVFVAFMVACVALTPSALAGGPATQSTDDLHQILFYVRDGGPMFVPERILQERPAEEVLPTTSAAILRNHLQAQRAPNLFTRMGKASYTLCELIEEPATEGGTISLSRIHELISDVATGLVAKVTGVTPGWHRIEGVAELAKLEVLEIFDAVDAHPLGVGSTLKVITPGGRLRYEEVVLCDETETVWHHPVAGEKVLVIGVPGESEPPGYFTDWMIFELRGEEVILQAERATGTAMRSVPLSQLVDGITPLQRDVK